MNNKVLVQYVKDKHKKMRGVLVAAKMPLVLDNADSDAIVSIGWSYTNFKAGDKFEKQRGIDIAFARMHSATNRRVPYQIMRDSKKFIDRAAKYYKINKRNIILVGNASVI